MKRRDVIRLATLTGFTAACAYCQAPIVRKFINLWDKDSTPENLGEVQKATATQQAKVDGPVDMKTKSTHYTQDFADDIFFKDRKFELVQILVKKFRAVERMVGNGNFNIVGIDEFFRLAAMAAGSSAVTNEEKVFLEEMFNFDAKKYGFQGDKVLPTFTSNIDKNSVLKVPYTGHFLRKGQSVATYQKICKDVGDSIILTSGVRGLAKQYHLFFEQALETKGNMSRASRSLAPPGYSFHGQGDFDVGKRGYGLKNFTNELTRSDEYKKLLDLGYVQIRYTESNLLGVRFEPWHIKIHA